MRDCKKNTKYPKSVEKNIKKGNDASGKKIISASDITREDETSKGKGKREGAPNGAVILAIHKRAFQDVYTPLMAGESCSGFKATESGRAGGRERSAPHFNMSRR